MLPKFSAAPDLKLCEYQARAAQHPPLLAPRTDLRRCPVASRRGLARIEVLVLAAVVILAAMAMLPMLGRTRVHVPQLKDSTCVRGIQQALVVFAQSNKDQYPLPSLLDAANAAINAPAATKDTTANIFSILIFNGATVPEMFVSSAEVNDRIRLKDDYQFESPQAAADPKNALWDPSFSADFTKGKIGNVSYAHTLPSGPRLKHWADTLDASQPIIANRGPEIASVTRDSKGRITPTLAKPSSNTLLIHGTRNTWEANFAFNDNHVEFQTWVAPGKRLADDKRPRYTAADGTSVIDLPNYDEPDDPAGTNHFLGIFTTAGEKPAEFKAIWD
jgi:hypothetical protein